MYHNKRDSNGKFVKDESPFTKVATKSESKRLSHQQGIHYFVTLIDESGSMALFTNKVKELIRSEYKVIQEESKKVKNETKYWVFSFKQPTWSKSLLNSPLKELVPITNINLCEAKVTNLPYYPSDGTPLYQAINDVLGTLLLIVSPLDTVFLKIITDGEENTSVYGSESVLSVCLKQNPVVKQRFTLALSLPESSESRKNQYLTLGFEEGNILFWKQTDKGFDTMHTTNHSTVTTMYATYNSGQTRSATVFKEVNLDNLTQKDLKTLTPITGVRTWEVEKEIMIKAFVESHNVTYSPGTCFYRLSKKEMVQAFKEVVIYDRINKIYYSGANARTLLGIPYGTNVKVTPGNFMTYDIYIQSHSNNRMLVRGTKLLYIK